VPAKAKLSQEQVKQIRRRFRAGEHLTELAIEYGVNRKTLRRRLDALELAEAEREARIAAKRLRRQAERERRTLRERERAAAPASIRSDRETGVRIGERGRARRLSPYEQWLETPKNLSGRAFAEARGLVRVRNPEGTVCGWRERAEIDALLEAGWLLA
jgi:hypothetical protein